MGRTNRRLLAGVALGASAWAGWSDEKDARAAIQQADIAFSKATVERRVEGFSSFIADDVATIRPNQAIVRGKNAFVEAWAPNLADPARTISWQPSLAEASKSGDLGYTAGSYAVKMTDANGTRVVGTGKYITIWGKQKDGSWKVVFDSGVQDAPPKP